MAREGTYDYLLDQLINSPEMRQKRIRWRDEGFQMTEAWFETWSGGGTLGSREAGLLLDAVAKDAENGDWGVYNWFLADNDADNYDLRIQFEYRLPESQFNRIHDTIRINVKEGMTETIRALKDLKLITDADLVTKMCIRDSSFPLPRSGNCPLREQREYPLWLRRESRPFVVAQETKKAGRAKCPPRLAF